MKTLQLTVPYDAVMEALASDGEPAFTQAQWIFIARALDYAATQSGSEGFKAEAHGIARQIKDAYR